MGAIAGSTESEPCYLRASELKVRLRITVPTIYKWVNANEFPKPVKFGRFSFWIASEIAAWEQARAAARYNEKAAK